MQVRKLCLHYFFVEIPALGIPMLVMHAPVHFDPTSWYHDCNLMYKFFFIYTKYRWMFEKYDGIRALWSGEARVYYSRFGTVLNMPRWAESIMPTVWLDGEFWYACIMDVVQIFMRVQVWS